MVFTLYKICSEGLLNSLDVMNICFMDFTFHKKYIFEWTISPSYTSSKLLGPCKDSNSITFTNCLKNLGLVSIYKFVPMRGVLRSLIMIRVFTTRGFVCLQDLSNKKNVYNKNP